MTQTFQVETIQSFAQNIVDTVREPLLMLDTTLRVHSANRAFYRTFKVSAGETENRLIYELGNGQWDIPALRTLLEEIVPTNSVFNDFELVHTFPTIGRRVMLLNARKLKAGDHGELVVLAMEDVTERRRAEEAVAKAAADLKAIETFAQNIVDTVREPLLILDADLCVHSANRSFYQVFRVSLEETENRLIYELGNGQWDIPALRTLLEDIIPQKSMFTDYELEHNFPTIGRRVMLLNARKLKAGDHGELLVLAIEDVTEKRRAHDIEVRFTHKLQESYRRLKELEKMRDDLMNMMVHDLRTPLTSVISGMQTLDAISDLNETQQEMIGIAISGGGILLDMINELLDVAKMESGEMRLEYLPLSPAALVTSAVSQVASLAENNGLTLVPQIGAELPSFQGDADKLRRTLVNLLGNAIKFTPIGGTVTVAVQPGEDGRSVLFSVSDTGEGIPSEAFGRIFEKFGQVELRQRGRKLSTGLGLTFCKLAVEAHGGSIWVDSVPERGSIFSFTIPLTTDTLLLGARTQELRTDENSSDLMADTSLV